MMQAEAWDVLLSHYALTAGVEFPVLLVLLSRKHSVAKKVFAGFWLSAVTQPIVVGVIPILIDPVGHRVMGLMVAETFAPFAECWLFRQISITNTTEHPDLNDYLAILIANLASFLAGAMLT